MKSFKTMMLLGWLAAAVLCAAAGAFAQNYPTKPIHVIVGFGPGGVADLTGSRGCPEAVSPTRAAGPD